MPIADVSRRYLIVKRLFDLAVCVLLLPVVLPLFLLSGCSSSAPWCGTQPSSRRS